MTKINHKTFLDDTANFLNLLRGASLIEDEKERKERTIQAVRNQLPTLTPFHRIEFANQLSGKHFDATTASLGWFTFKLLLDGAQGEEKKLLQLVADLVGK